PPATLGARGDEPDEFRAILEDAVRCRLRSSAPVGVYLSGGLDSGSVASVAGRLLGPGSGALRAYTIVYDRFAKTDEREYAAAVVDAYALPQRLISGDGGWTLAELEPWLPVFSEPMFGAFDTLNYHALPAALDDGVRVLLTGHGGDVLLLRSPSYFASWLVHGHWRALARQLSRKRETGRLGYGYQF